MKRTVCAIAVVALALIAAARGAEQPKTPNHYVLAGGGLHVIYSTSGIDGKPHLNYQEGKKQTLSFRGDEIRSVETEIGTLVSVTLRRTAEGGCTTFSLLLPRVTLPNGANSVSIRTEGITTLRRDAQGAAAGSGQLDTYTVAHLRGTAGAVVF